MYVTLVHDYMYIYILLYWLYFLNDHLGAIEALTGSAFGADNVQFTHTYIGCQGNEVQLSDCYGFTEYQAYANSCPSTHAAGVRCLGTQTTHDIYIHVYILWV